MKVFKWLFISVFGFAGLVLGSYVAFKLVVSWSMSGVGIDGGAGSWALRSLFHDGPRYYELTTNLEVDSEPVKIKRVIECKPYFAHRFGNHFQKRWYTDQEAMTQRLTDGSGLIVVVPRLCEEFASPQPERAPSWKSFPELPKDFVPLIFWTSDADNPEVLEGYQSFDSLSRPGSRILFKGIVLRNSLDLEPGDYPEEFGVWINRHYGGLRGGDRPSRTINYRGYYLLSLRREDWERVPELSVGIEAMASSGFLKPELKTHISGLSTDHDEVAITGSLRIRQSSERKSSREFVNFQVDVLRELQGFEQESDKLVPHSKYKGVVTYFLSERHKEPGPRVWVRVREVNVVLNGETLVWPTKGTESYYDKNEGMIYTLGFSFLSFHPERTVNREKD